ncbi:tetraacyldisaccharide 4'-kinase [Thermocrinis minervae]|uniref:Tetraacyldisaccharide 4'-kinase n=1 Tax=Thermocrinis minervae TaxID=381751 RepID=A0A1M6R2F7_9AQUI|nr:tetraacyldisaccharide 4'-kinase [Thermocrinis minervae]SHK26685.1 lipid-A-disaccharide kinase [Thermocrinis minervae]
MNPYALAVRIRNFLYDRSLLKKCHVPTFVISVGNLSVGGSGKTSLVRYLAKELSKELKVCILLRGYKRKTRGTLLVSHGDGPLCKSWQECGDEAFMLATILKGVSVVVDEDRCRGAKYAIDELKPQVIILDDGFQHRRIERDLDILLIKRSDLKDRLLPFGRLREPLDSIRRASAIVLSYQDLYPLELNTDKPTFRMFRKDWKVLDARLEPVEDYRDLEFTAFCGLGDNSQFFETLDRLGIKVVERLSFPDHYDYSGFKKDPNKLYITTLKDFVKFDDRDGLYVLDFSLEVPGFLEYVKTCYNISVNSFKEVENGS